MTNQTNSVRQVQGCILQIMKYIDAICRKHGIVYYIMGGTALGAVRHGGFIPWDDDLDIFMVPGSMRSLKLRWNRRRATLLSCKSGKPPPIIWNTPKCA